MGPIRLDTCTIGVTHQIRSCLDHGKINERYRKDYMHNGTKHSCHMQNLANDRQIIPERQTKRFGILLRMAKLQINKLVCRKRTSELCSGILAERNGKETSHIPSLITAPPNQVFNDQPFRCQELLFHVTQLGRTLTTQIKAYCLRREEQIDEPEVHRFCRYSIDYKNLVTLSQWKRFCWARKVLVQCDALLTQTSPTDTSF